jgi:hypothetical protein
LRPLFSVSTKDKFENGLATFGSATIFTAIKCAGDEVENFWQAVVALRPDQLEVFNCLRVIEGRVAVAAKFGNPLFGVRGLGRLQNFFDLLFANLRVNDVKDPVLAHEFLVVFHGDVDDIDYAK